MISFVIFEIYEALLVVFQVDYITASRRLVPTASNVIQSIDKVSYLINYSCIELYLARRKFGVPKDVRPVTLLTYYSQQFQNFNCKSKL